MSLARGAGESGALFIWSKTMPNNASWLEDLQVIEGSEAMSWTDLDVRITLRDCKNDSPVLTLETGDGRLVIDVVDSTILHITVPPSDLNGLCGDYTGDIAYRDAGGDVFLLAHGTVSVRDNPPAFP